MTSPSSRAPSASGPALSERRLLFLIGAVQFVNVLDFMMVMPLGPDFAAGLGIPASKLGLIGGAYTASAALAGLVGALFLDRFDRRNALTVALLGLAAGTAAGGLAQGLYSMLVARLLAGAFGGPATALALAALTDLVPQERRGKAIGAVVGVFAVASVLGVPAGLELARWGGWRLPFFSVAGLGLVAAMATLVLMPPLRLHLERPSPSAGAAPARSLGAFLADRSVVAILAAIALATVGIYAVVPVLSPFLIFNLGYPREQLGLLYLGGGVVAFVATRVGGVLTDRHGPIGVIVVGTSTFMAVCVAVFVFSVGWFPPLALFMGLMFSSSFRIVAVNSLGTRVPWPSERARFMSSQSAVQHLAASVAAVVGALLLHERADHVLVGVPRVGWLAVAASLPVPVLVALVARWVAQRQAQTPGAQGEGAAGPAPEPTAERGTEQAAERANQAAEASPVRAA